MPHQVHGILSRNSPAQAKSSQFAPRPFAVQAQQDSHRPLTQEEIENEAFYQNKFQASALQLKKKHGTITPVEQERLGMLQAKMDDFWAQRLERSSGFGHSLAVTGLPDNLKSGIESLSGISMDNVAVHYNSPKPAQLNALAYAQGTDIHIAPGQERHVPHEAWHVVQQAQGRVKPTMQMSKRSADPSLPGTGGVPVNDDEGLEHEADVMGARADSYPSSAGALRKTAANTSLSCPVQLKLSPSDAFALHDKQTKYGDVDFGLHRRLVNKHDSLSEAVKELVQVRGPYPGMAPANFAPIFVQGDKPGIGHEESPTMITDKGRVMIKPDVLDDALTAPQEEPRKPIVDKFHQDWQSRRDDPSNAAYPNWLPPVPPNLKGVALNEYLRVHNKHYPTVKVSTADTLHHFTTDEGARGMTDTQMMYPSVVAGMQTTHYGRGVYFSDQGPEDLASKTHGDVTRAIYTRDSAENRRRSKHLASVDVSDMLILKMSLKDKAPVFMHPTVEPIDVSGRLQIRPTAKLVQSDIPPSLDHQPIKKGKPKPIKAPSVPKQFPGVDDWDTAYKDYERVKVLYPEKYAKISFEDFLKDYWQDM